MTNVAPPSSPTIAAHASTSLTLSWGSNGNAAGTTYVAQALDPSSNVAASSRTANTQALLSGLTPNTTYTLRVQAAAPGGNLSVFTAAAPFAADAAAPVAAAPPSARQQRGPSSEGQPVMYTPMSPTPPRSAAPGQSNLDLVHDVPLETSAVLGQTELSLREVVAMQPGSVFELDKLSTEPIDLYVNKILIARGEVVVVDDKFAVKISELNPVVDKL